MYYLLLLPIYIYIYIYIYILYYFYINVQMEPLRNEMAQLTKENNQLHMDLIRAADLRDERERKTQLIVRRYQNDIADLNFLNKQLQSKIGNEQRRAEAERFRLEHVMQLIGNTVGKELDGIARGLNLNFFSIVFDMILHDQ
jgi:hypothetical protein